MRRTPIVFMFSGQGSQYYQMGRELYDAHPAFRRTLERCDRFVHERAGFSLIDAIYSRPRGEPFDDLRLSHPALVAVELATYDLLRAEGVVADRHLGASLGELVAAAAAGCCSYETALAVALAHARNVADHCAPGGMLAVLAPPAALDALPCRGRDLTFAGENFPAHFTVSGGLDAIGRAESDWRAAGVNSIRLPVRYAFHSPAMARARAPFLDVCRSFEFSGAPQVPVVSALSTEAVPRFDADHFWAVVGGPMRFRDTIRRFETQGPSLYVDCGPSGTSATFVKYNLDAASGSKEFSILSPFGTAVRNLEKLKTELRSH